MPIHFGPNDYLTTYEHHHNITGQIAVCTMGFQYTGSNFTADYVVLPLAWGQKIMASISAVWTYDNFKISNGEGTLHELAQLVQGGKAGSGTMPGVCYIIDKNTSVAGRKGKGRMYLPGVTEAEVDDAGRVTSSMRTELNNAFAAWKTQVAAANFQQFLLNAEGVGIGTPISTMTANTFASYQRRRAHP